MTEQTRERTERDELLDLYSDLHKSARGFRPHNDEWNVFISMSTEQLRERVREMGEESTRACEFEEEQEKARIAAFESHIKKMMDDHNIDRETAMRWDQQALGLERDIHFYGLMMYEEQYGLPSGYFAD